MYTGVTTWWSDLKENAADEGGATAVEYALMVALIAVVIIGAVTVIGQRADASFTTTGNALQ
jgi:pilus assembly protein Flp/PilA